jgi:hypothetical protein
MYVGEHRSIFRLGEVRVRTLSYIVNLFLERLSPVSFSMIYYYNLQPFYQLIEITAFKTEYEPEVPSSVHD